VADEVDVGAEGRRPGNGVSDPVAAIDELLRRHRRDVAGIVGTVARAHGLRSGDLHALLEVYLGAPGNASPTPGDLGRALSLTSGTVTAVVDRLVVSGHVHRGPDPVDRRRVRLRATDAGERVAREVLDSAASGTGAAAAALSSSRLEAVHDFLTAMAEATAADLRARRGAE
jgi:DNA-binding MarR family transcriptional regulator